MKITPLEIRQKEFEKGFRGYEKDDVKAFLTSLSQEWERVMDTQKELRLKLEAAEKEVEKLRQVESSLYKTLKTAEDTGANVIDQANKSAELHLKETQMKADALLNEAKSKANSILEEASNKARSIMEDMEEDIKELAGGFRQLEGHRDNLLSELRHLSQDILDKSQKMEDRQKDIDVDVHMKRAKKAVRKALEEAEEATIPEVPASTPAPKKEKEVKEAASEKKNDDDTSFFDELI